MGKPKKPPKDLLAEELGKRVVDYGLVLALSLELAKEDQDVVRFSVDASHIERLGRELVARQETAVAELVKNAYDADATELELVFQDSDEPGGSVALVDNGHGMTRQELIDGFMRISTQDKVDHPVSRKYGRERAGRKGIGRFAAQRLGRRLTIITQTYRSREAHKVTIDWTGYEGHRDLMLIQNKIETVDKERARGTSLLIEDLRDGWTEAQIKRAFRYTAGLLQPFPLSKKRKARPKDSEEDPGFKVVFKRETDGELSTVSDDVSTFHEHALAVIEGRVDDEGRGSWSLNCERFDEHLKDQPIGPGRNDPPIAYENLRNIRFKVHYFIAMEEYVPPNSDLHDPGDVKKVRRDSSLPKWVSCAPVRRPVFRLAGFG